MNTLSVSQVMDEIIRLPSLPMVVLDVMRSFEKEDIEVDQIVNELAKDQALSARVLRLANSSFYGLQSKIATLHNAVVVIGFRQLRSTVAVVSITQCFTNRHLPNFDFPSFWRHSTAVGLAAQASAKKTGHSTEIAFMAGLLHDIGRLVLLSSFPKHTAEVLNFARAENCLMLDAEHAVIGIDHAMVGKALAEQWQFPSVIGDAIGAHHQPDTLPATSLAGVVHLADAITHAMGVSNDSKEWVPPLSDITFNRLNLNVTDLQQIMETVETRIDPGCKALLD